MANSYETENWEWINVPEWIKTLEDNPGLHEKLNSECDGVYWNSPEELRRLYNIND